VTVEAIIERIRTNAGQRAGEIERAARAEAEAICRLSEAEGREAHARTSEEARREGAAIADRILSVARMDARTAVNEARSALIRVSIERAEEEFGTLAASPEYPEILGRLIEEGRLDLGEESAVIEGRERDLPLIRGLAEGIAGGRLSAVPAPDGTVPTGGVILRSEQGGSLVNQTFEARMQRMRLPLVMEIGARLFREERP
jgi:vacuolar-type H+-ATPase subunit E/Vma4